MFHVYASEGGMSRRIIFTFVLILLLGATFRAVSAQSLVVLNKSAATATIVDVQSGETVATIPVGVGPHEAVVSRDGRWAVAANYGQRSGGNTLSVIDVPARQVVRTIDLGQYTRPHGLAFLPGDSLVAVTSETTMSVVLVRVADGAIVKDLSTGAEGSHMLALVGDGETIYTSNLRDDTVTEIDVATGDTRQMFDTPPQPEAIGVTPSGSEVWVGSNGAGTFTVIDVSSGETRGTIEGFGFPYRVLFTPDERLVILPDFRGDETRILERATLRELKRFSFPGGGPQGVTLSGDGTILYQALARGGQVVAIDLETLEEIRRYDVGPTPDGVGWAR